MNKEEIMRGFGTDAQKLAQIYIGDPSADNREALKLYLETVQDVKIKMLGRSMSTEERSKYNELLDNFNARVNVFLEESLGILAAYPTVKSFKFVDGLLRMLKK